MKDPWIACRCPRCGIEHRERLRWRGRGIPRTYCIRCDSYIEFLAPEDLDPQRVPGDGGLRMMAAGLADEFWED